MHFTWWGGGSVRTVSVSALDREPGVDRPVPARRFAVRGPLLVACIVVAVPFVILALRLLFSHWVSTADTALEELRVRDVGSPRTPLVGPWSRYGWNHPGPLIFYLLAIPYRALGAGPGAFLAGAAVINALAVVASAILLWRRGRFIGCALGLVITLAVVRALGGTFLGSPWNPYLIVLPLLALVLVVWSVASGDSWLLPVVVALGSFVIQSHVGAAAVVLALVGIATVAVGVDGRRGRVRRYHRVLGWSAAVAAFLWWPPILEQFRHDGGNLTKLWSFWTASHDSTPGIVNGARASLRRSFLCRHRGSRGTNASRRSLPGSIRRGRFPSCSSSCAARPWSRGGGATASRSASM